MGEEDRNAKREPMTEDELAAVTMGPRKPVNGPIRLDAYDPAWPSLFEEAKKRIRAALGARALSIEHVGSTSIPGLCAKPIIDILLTVSDSACEPTYLPDLESVGFYLRIREPNWFEHRLFKADFVDTNLHVFSVGCEEIDRMLTFRDQLRGNDHDRILYENTKRQLAARHWKYTQNYADAKSDIVEEILARANS